MAKFKVKGNDLYIDGEKVLRGWESFNGWYWFATEKSGEQLSDFGDGEGVPDTIWFGCTGPRRGMGLLLSGGN